MLLDEGWLAEARRVPSPHYDCRPDDENPSLLVVHNISLPPGEFGGPWIDALLGHGEKALPAWFASLADLHTSQYQVLTRLAQFSLAREPHTDKVATPKAAVSMAKKTSFVVVVVIAVLTIYGTLI